MSIKEAISQSLRLNRSPLVANIEGVEIVNLTKEIQRRLGCVINKDVFLECPYAFVSRQILHDVSRETNSPLHHLVEKICTFTETVVLIGYASDKIEIDGSGRFIICLTEETTSAFISYNRLITKNLFQIVQNKIRKKVRPWKDQGTVEELVESFMRMSRALYEINVYLPISKLCREKQLSDRGSGDVRDGYIELVPYEDFENIFLSTNTQACQTNLESKDAETQTYPGKPKNTWTEYEFEIPVDFQDIWKYEEESDKEENSDEENDGNSLTENKKEMTEEELQIKEKRRIEWEKLNNFLKSHIDEIIDAISFDTSINLYADDIANLNMNESSLTLTETCTNYCERVSLVDLKIIKDKYLFSASWHCELNNIIICAYSDKQAENCSLIILWSLLSPLRPKKILNCEEKISTISFCSKKNYTDIVIGGCLDGKVVVWEINKHWLLDEEKKRDNILNSDNCVDSLIKEAKIATSAAKAQKLSIVSIQWLPSWCRIKPDGNFEKICYNCPKELKPYFATASRDGTIFFWNLPRSLSNPVKIRSPFHLTIAPIYQLVFEMSDEKIISRIEVTCFNFPLAESEESLNLNIRDQSDLGRLRKVFIGTTMGEVLFCSWEGQILKADATNYETCRILTRSCVHDGIVRTMTKSPYLDDVFLTVGGRIFAIWKEDFPNAPIFQRRSKEFRYGEGCWSGRSGVFILARLDGGFELWDLKENFDEPLLLQILSEKLTLYVYPSPPNAQETLLAVLDGPSVLRIFVAPNEDSKDKNLERIEWFEEFVWRETKRKYDFHQWQNNHLQHHPTALTRKAKRDHDKANRKHEKAREQYLREQEVLAQAETQKKLAKRRVSKSTIWQKIEQKRIEIILLQKKGFVPSELEEKRKPVVLLEEQRKARSWKTMIELARNKEILQKCLAKEIPEAIFRKDATEVKDASDTALRLENNANLKNEEEYQNLRKKLIRTLSQEFYIPEFNWQKVIESDT